MPSTGKPLNWTVDRLQIDTLTL